VGFYKDINGLRKTTVRKSKASKSKYTVIIGL
jgi:hypothetical protein